MMAFVSADRDAAADRLMNANERYVDHDDDANVAMSRIIGLPFSRALQAFAGGDYCDCVDQLLPIRYRTHRLGGSAAQRDIIGLTLLEAALRCGQFELALALAHERCGVKPTSPQNWKTVARIHHGMGNQARAEQAEAKALSLIAA